MYLIRVIPLHRKIPDGELSYISKSSYKKGSILNVPLKKSIEMALVVSSKKVSEEKSYIKSLPFALLNLPKNEDYPELLPNVMPALTKFSTYSLCPLDLVLRSLFGKSNVFKKNKKIEFNDDTIVISSRKEKDCVSFHEFIFFFTKGQAKIKKIIIKDPERLSDYGHSYLGFDPVAFIVILAKELKIDLTFSSLSRLRYKEWDVDFDKPSLKEKQNLFIISRQDESPEEKSLAISPLLQEKLADWAKENKKILIVSTTKGFSPKTSCADCASLHLCSNCKSPLRLVKNGRSYAKIHGIAGDYLYICFNCKLAETAFAKCRNCDSWHLVPLGYGIERVKENVENIIPKKKVYDFSERFSIREYKDWQEKGGICIASMELIRDIENPDICIIPSLAGILYGQSFEASEKARYLVEYKNQVLDKMIVFTMRDEEKSFLEVNSKDWIKSELEDRKNFHYPPFSRYLSVTLSPYASKSPKLIEALTSILNKESIEKTVTSDTNSLGIVTISACFPAKNWSIKQDKYELADSLYNSLLYFMEHLHIKVY